MKNNHKYLFCNDIFSYISFDLLLLFSKFLLVLFSNKGAKAQ